MLTRPSSMSVVVANPITYYTGWPQVVISQAGQSGDLYNYYWTSYSRGTDGNCSYGQPKDINWHNLYLDSYIPLKHKSIYDPCPYGYRIPSNGTYNQFTSNRGWRFFSYIGGASRTVDNTTWFVGCGSRSGTAILTAIGYRINIWHATLKTANSAYLNIAYSETISLINGSYNVSTGLPVRCIEECEEKKKTLPTNASKVFYLSLYKPVIIL